MRFTTTDLKEFDVIGITVRTINQHGRSKKDISELWQKFFRDDIIEQIPNKESNDIYCIYTDYETDFNGPYTTLLGCKVSRLEYIPQGLIGKTIPESKFQLYKSTGKVPDCVLATWRLIWQSDIDRKYLADFDVYTNKLQDPDNAEVKTYVSVN